MNLQAKTALDSNFTFDVRVLSPKTGWVSVARHENPSDARKEARQLVDGERHEGVKITQEHFDYLENKFIEKTIFLRTKSGNSLPDATPEYSSRGLVKAPEDDSGNFLLMAIAGAVLLLAVFAGTGFFYLDKENGHQTRTSESLFRYDLPTVMTNFTKNGRNYSLQLSLQLELYRPEHAKDIEANLATVMESVIRHVQDMNPEDFNNSGRLQYMRAMLRRKVKESIGDADFNDILFNDIQVRAN